MRIISNLIQRFYAFLNNKKTRRFIEWITLSGNQGIGPSSLAYYLVISLVPISTMIVLILSIFDFSNDYVAILLKQIPIIGDLDLLKIKDQLLDNNPYFISIIISLFFTIFLASKSTYSFLKNYENNTGEKAKKSHYIQKRLYSVVFTIIYEILFAFFIVFLTFFQYKIGIIFHIKILIEICLSILFLFIFFCSLFSLPYGRKWRFKHVYLGAIFSTISTLVCLSAYTYYLSFITRAHVYYGSLSNFIFLLLLLYYCAYLSLLGSHLNHLKYHKQNI